MTLINTNKGAAPLLIIIILILLGGSVFVLTNDLGQDGDKGQSMESLLDNVKDKVGDVTVRDEERRDNNPFSSFKDKQEQGTSSNEPPVPQTPTPAPAPLSPSPLKGPTTHTITYSTSGYSPSVLTITKGDTVRFVNNGGLSMWTATDNHPSHTLYPGSDINRCFEQGPGPDLFDQCEAGDEWSFRFNKEGEWGYHNHRRASHVGVIIVK